MDLKNLTVFNLANQNMRYLSAKQRVIAANIANASTPNYLAQDIEKPDFLQNLTETKSTEKLPLRVTNAKHFSMLKSEAVQKSQEYVIYTPQPKDALTIDRNGVILEDQMNEASKASSEYKKMISIYNAYKNMITLSNTKING